MADPIEKKQRMEGEEATLVRISLSLVSIEAVLKTCYWFSRDFLCTMQDESTEYATVLLRAKRPLDLSIEVTRDAFVAQTLDFVLRDRVAAQTAGVRDLLLAKAFSEAGVLEDGPTGVFGDAVEEAKPNGLFKILANS
jgi:His-Xaa-Ser system protein HxsD